MTDTISDILEPGDVLPLGDDLKHAIDAWFAHLTHERGQSPKTLEAYERDLRQFLAFLKIYRGHPPCLGDLAAIDAKTMRAFLAGRRKQGAVSRSLSRTLSALRMFFRWLDAEYAVKNRAVLQVSLPKIPHSVPKPLNVEAAAAVVTPQQAILGVDIFRISDFGFRIFAT